MKANITIYCGSSARLPEQFTEAASELGRHIAAAGANLVYGAGRTGLMGAAADAALAAGGTVTGVIPDFMVQRGWHHRGLTKLEVTDSMHARKTRMLELANGVIALPGGLGTFDELAEAMTWRQLGLYGGNVVIYNVCGYYDAFVSQLHSALENGFVNDDHLALFKVVDTAGEAVRCALMPPAKVCLTPKF